MIKCPNCCYEGGSKSKSKGSCLIATLLLIFVFPVGIFYMFWMVLRYKQVCPRCNYEYVVKN